MNAFAPHINAIATAVPPHVLHQAAVADRAGHVFTGRDFEHLRPVYANAEIETRHSCTPIEWYETGHSFAERNRLYVDNALALLEHATRNVLDRAGLDPREVDGIVIASTTGIATPSLDAMLVDRLGLRRDVERLPIFGLGCAGGVLGLARTAALAKVRPGSHWLFLVVELCGLTFRSADQSKSNVIATALFGDGAAACLVSSDPAGPAITGWGEHIFAASLDVMGWDVVDDGLKVVFSRDIPTLVRKEIGALVAAFLERERLALSDIAEFCCHPGGAKVLDALEDVFGVRRGGLVHSRNVLRRYGNMSAATVLFVLAESLAAAAAADVCSPPWAPASPQAFCCWKGREYPALGARPGGAATVGRTCPRRPQHPAPQGARRAGGGPIALSADRAAARRLARGPCLAGARRHAAFRTAARAVRRFAGRPHLGHREPWPLLDDPHHHPA